MCDEFPSELAHKIERLLWIVNSFRGQFIMYSTDLYGMTNHGVLHWLCFK